MQTQSELTPISGVISAGNNHTVQAGAAMLRQGGNAVDAAVAAAFASFIAEIGVVHLGGSGIAHLYDSRSGRSFVYDFFSNTPGIGGTPPHALDFEEVTIDFGATTQSFHLGRASVAVPGNIFGLCQMAADYGRLPLTKLLQPAITLARDGVNIAPFQADTCNLLTPLYTHTAGMREVFARSGHVIQAHEPLYIPHLAHTLTQLAEQGVSLLRHGRLGHALIADQQANGGLLTADDLQQYQVHTVPSIRIPYREFEILLPPLSSVGGIFTAFTFKLLAGFNVGNIEHGSAKHLQLLYEVMVTTSLARMRWDQRHPQLQVEKAVAEFLSEAFIRPYRDRVRHALESGTPSIPVAEPKGPNNTSHLSVVDGHGLAVSLTNTAGESAGYIVPETGFIPNNMMGEADLHPNGFHSRPPGQRIHTMMTPTIVLKDNRPRLVLGSGGSVRIRSAILQVLSNLLDFHMSLNDAVNTARVHVEEGILQCEAGYDLAAVEQLAQMGYPVNRWPIRSLYFGGVHSVSRTDAGRLAGAGDSRRDGATAQTP